MAFLKSAQHVGLAGKGTLAECQAWIASLTAPIRLSYVGSTLHVTDQGAQDLWVISETTIYPIKDLVPDYIQGVAQTDSVTLDVDANANISATLKTRTNGAIDATSQGVGVRVADTSSVDMSIDGSNNVIATVKRRADVNNILAITADGLDVNVVTSVSPTAVANPLTDTLDGVSSTGINVNVRLNDAADNALTVGSSPASANGLYVKSVKIAADSVGILTLNSNNELSFDKHVLVDVHVDAVSTSAADFFANVIGTLTTPVGVGDFVYIPNAPKTERSWVVKTANPTSIADLVPVEFPDYTVAEIGAMFSAVSGVQYNATTRTFSAKLDSVAPRNDMQVSTEGLLVDVYAAASDITGGIGSASLTANLAELYSRTNTLNAITYENLITKTGSKVELGGVATKDTNMALLDNVMTYTATGDGGMKLLTNNIMFLESFYIKNELGEMVKMSVAASNFWKGEAMVSNPF